MLILTGPSASGKTEVAKVLIEKHGFKKLVTYTTRTPRINEVNEVDYNFVSVEEFFKLRDNNEFVETTYYNDNYYGSRLSDVAFHKVIILDPSGVNEFRRKLKDKVVIIFLNTPAKLRKERMKKRKDAKELIEMRLKNDDLVFTPKAYDYVDYTYKNETIDLDELAKEINKCYINHFKLGK